MVSHVRPSQIDSTRFGISVGRADPVVMNDLPALLSSCEQSGIDLLIARCPASDTATVQAMIEAGFRFMDGEVHYRGAVETDGLMKRVIAPMRPAQPEDQAEVVGVAASCFNGFMSHYHSDSRLNREQSDAVYPSWASRCCTGEAADVVLVTELDGRLAGFSAFRTVSETEGQLVLGAVMPWANGRGLYGQMTLAGAAWCRERGLKTLLAITQLGNLPSQRTWANLGMKPTASAYTFHRWFGPKISADALGK